MNPDCQWWWSAFSSCWSVSYCISNKNKMLIFPALISVEQVSWMCLWWSKQSSKQTWNEFSGKQTQTCGCVMCVFGKRSRAQEHRGCSANRLLVSQQQMFDPAVFQWLIHSSITPWRKRGPLCTLFINHSTEIFGCVSISELRSMWILWSVVCHLLMFIWTRYLECASEYFVCTTLKHLIRFH